MDEVKPFVKVPRVNKQTFERKVNRKDGLVLQVHHSSPGPTGEIRRSRFLYASFSSCNELLAVADHRASIFLIDLANNQFWLLRKFESVSVLCFHSENKDELLVGCSGHSIALLSAGAGHELGRLTGHTEAPEQVTFSSRGHYCLTVARNEGLIWDMRSLIQAYRLNLQPGMLIKQAVFMPVSDNVLACFQDDAIHVWAFETFQCVKQIVPDTWKGKNLRSISFTRDGRAMVVGGESRQLVAFTVDNWTAQRTIELPEPVRHLEFVPEPYDGGANKVLAVLSTSGSLYFVDVASGSLLNVKVVKNIVSFVCSKTGKYMACNSSSGEVKIFITAQLLSNKADWVAEVAEVAGDRDIPLHGTSEKPSLLDHRRINAASRGHTNKDHLSKVSQQVKSVLDLTRLRPILREFSEYPDQYRALIWRTVLKLPGNKGPWQSLAKRPLHPVAKKLSETYPIQNKIMLSCLQSVISCLVHWSPVFGEVPYLPHFIFPFVKVFHSDTFVCFEASATIIVNWCQHWFEYLSFPPINILGMVENILSEHDLKLLRFFCSMGITSRQYAWSLLSSAFSKVLTSSQWKQLWDHVVSNPPWFLLYAVVAYNICCRTSLKTCSSKDDFEFFYNNQNPVNMKQFLKKSYELMDNTSEENHPSQYLKTFTPLTQGNYPVFAAYPKFIVNHQKQQREAVYQEEQNILMEQRDLIAQQLAREEVRLREHKARIHEERLMDAEKAANAAVQAEELRLAERRRELTSLRRELRTQEKDAVARTRVEIMEHHAKQRCAQLDRLYHQLHCKAKESGIDAKALGVELHEQIGRLLAQKQELLQQLKSQDIKQIPPDDDLSELINQQQLLKKEVMKLKEETKPRSHGDIEARLVEVDILRQRLELELARKAKIQHDLLLDAEQCINEAQAEAKVKDLENEISHLLDCLTSAYKDINTTSKSASHGSNSRSSHQQPATSAFKYSNGEDRSEFYKQERSAVTSAMEIRKSLLSRDHYH